MNIINTVKFIGGALVVLGGAVSAYILNSRAKGTLARAEGMIGFLRYVKTQVDCYSMPLEKILSGCGEDVYAECGYLKSTKPQSLDEFISSCPSLDGGTLKIMKDFAEGFGKSYRTEQVKLCDRCIDELSLLRSDISEKLPMRRKLNSTLCLSGAMAIVILLV